MEYVVVRGCPQGVTSATRAPSITWHRVFFWVGRWAESTRYLVNDSMFAFDGSDDVLVIIHTHFDMRAAYPARDMLDALWVETMQMFVFRGHLFAISNVSCQQRS